MATGLVGCADKSPQGDGRDDSFTTDGKLDGFQCTPAEAAAILKVANTASMSTLLNDVDLEQKAADNIVAFRNGDDEDPGTADDGTFGSLAQLDAVPYIGPVAFQALLQYVHDADLVDNTVPVGAQWSFETIANGHDARPAMTSDTKLVLTYYTTDIGVGPWKLRLPNGTEVALPSELVGFSERVYPAVDDDGVPHVFYAERTTTNNITKTVFKHVSYVGGQLTNHDPLVADELWVDNSPDGKLFALGRKANCGSCTSTLTLYTHQGTGVMAAETLWGTSEDREFHFTVGNDGFPAFVDASGVVRYARRAANGWMKIDAVASTSSDSVAVTGGVSATLFVANNDGMATYQQNGTSFGKVDQREFSDYTPKLDATTDGNGTAHACFIKGGNAVHLQVDATGNVVEQSLGNAEDCHLETDSQGKVHMFLNLGSVVNHGTIQ